MYIDDMIVKEVEVDTTGKTLAIIGVRSAGPAVHVLIGHLETEIDDLEWIVSRMKAEFAEHTNLAAGLEQVLYDFYSLLTYIYFFILVCNL